MPLTTRSDGSAPLLDTIERYYDAVPRSAARAEEIGPFTLFITTGPGWPYYARPALGAQRFAVSEVHAVRARQRDLAIPQSFEWMHQSTPGLRDVVAAAGLRVSNLPLLVLHGDLVPTFDSPGMTIRLATADDDLGMFTAVARVAFGSPGTEIGPGDAVAARALATAPRAPFEDAFQRQRVVEGHTVTAVAFLEGEPIAVGSHQPVGHVTEVVGVGVLPAFRRRGIAAALTRFLAEDARSRGASTIFLSAGDDRIARVYTRAGFHQIGIACMAEPPST